MISTVNVLVLVKDTLCSQFSLFSMTLATQGSFWLKQVNISWKGNWGDKRQ